MIFRDRGKRTEFEEYTLWSGIAYFKVQTETSKSTYFTLFFIDFNPYPVVMANAATLTVLIVFRNSIAMTV